MRGIRVAIDVVAGWVEEMVVMGMLVVRVCVLSSFIGSAAKWQGYHSPDSSERQSRTHGPAELAGSDMPALDSLRAASLFTHHQEKATASPHDSR